jgi:hypothetical protein
VQPDSIVMSNPNQTLQVLNEAYSGGAARGGTASRSKRRPNGQAGLGSGTVGCIVVGRRLYCACVHQSGCQPGPDLSPWCAAAASALAPPALQRRCGSCCRSRSTLQTTLPSSRLTGGGRMCGCALEGNTALSASALKRCVSPVVVAVTAVAACLGRLLLPAAGVCCFRWLFRLLPCSLPSLRCAAAAWCSWLILWLCLLRLAPCFHICGAGCGDFG